MRKYFSIAAVLYMIAAVSCTKEDPIVPQAVTVKATIAENCARFTSFVEGDVIGVFVSSEKFNQDNLKFTPRELGEVEDFGTQLMLSTEVKTTELIPASDSASFGAGSHTYYAYMPYASNATITAVPVQDLTTQDYNSAMNCGKQFLPYNWIFQYAKAEANAAAPVDFKFVCPITEINNGAARTDYITLPAEVASQSIKNVKITASGPIAYKNPTFDLTTEKFNGEPVNSITITCKKSGSSLSMKFAVCCDKATALKYDYTIDLQCENGDVYTGTTKLSEGKIPQAVDYTADYDVVKLNAPTFRKK